jgi:hypothetical protein
MKTIRLAVIFLSFASAALAADAATWFTFGYARGEKVAHQGELLIRLNNESMMIAEVLVEADLMHATRISVIPSSVNSNGFETKFECSEGQAAIFRETRRADEVHNAIGKRYEQLIAGDLSPEKIKDPAVLPIGEYLKRLRRNG